MTKKNPFGGLVSVLNTMPVEVLESIGHGLVLRQAEITRVRKSLVTAGYDLSEADAELDLLKGTKETLGLLAALDFDEEKKEKDAKDPAVTGQRSTDDPRDFRTHGLNTQKVRELVSSIVSENPPVEAIRTLNALEDGEREKEGGSRDSVLKVIRDARTPLTKKVGGLGAGSENGGPQLHKDGEKSDAVN